MLMAHQCVGPSATVTPVPSHIRVPAHEVVSSRIMYDRGWRFRAPVLEKEDSLRCFYCGCCMKIRVFGNRGRQHHGRGSLRANNTEETLSEARWKERKRCKGTIFRGAQLAADGDLVGPLVHAGILRDVCVGHDATRPADGSVWRETSHLRQLWLPLV